MPLYDVKCNSCELLEEVLKRAEEKIFCSRCGHDTTKLLGPSNFQLKGSGWARDLYASPPDSKSDAG